VPRAQLSRRRLLGLDRSGPPPPQTAPGQPWRPWTLPNAIGYLRAALIPAFLVCEYASRHGVSTAAGICFFFAGGGDYLDGIAARLTGQYSRLGAALDPLIDRLLVLAGAAACWSYELLPRPAAARARARDQLGRPRRRRADDVRDLARGARRERGRRGLLPDRPRACLARRLRLPARRFARGSSSA